MTNYGFLLVQRMTMLALLLAGFLSIQACQLNAPGPQKEAIASSSLSPIASVSYTHLTLPTICSV